MFSELYPLSHGKGPNNTGSKGAAEILPYLLKTTFTKWIPDGGDKQVCMSTAKTIRAN